MTSEWTNSKATIIDTTLKISTICLPNSQDSQPKDETDDLKG